MKSNRSFKNTRVHVRSSMERKDGGDVGMNHLRMADSWNCPFTPLCEGKTTHS